MIITTSPVSICWLDSQQDFTKDTKQISSKLGWIWTERQIQDYFFSLSFASETVFFFVFF